MMIVIAPDDRHQVEPAARPDRERRRRTPGRAGDQVDAATTMVAAWIRADTGVGPAMASGSQVWSGNWALLPITAMNRAMAPHEHRRWLIWPLEGQLVDLGDVEGLAGAEEQA